MEQQYIVEAALMRNRVTPWPAWLARVSVAGTNDSMAVDCHATALPQAASLLAEALLRVRTAIGQSEKTVVDDAWHALATLHGAATWRGVQIAKQQFDLARYFHLIAARRPEVIGEIGLSGSARFFMDCLEMLGMPDVPFVGVDLDCTTLAPAVVDKVRERIAGRRSLVVLDSVPRARVVEALRLYAPLCVPGSSLVIENTDNGGEFMVPGGLGASLGFEHDREIEHMFGTFTAAPSGWLVRR